MRSESRAALRRSSASRRSCPRFTERRRRSAGSRSPCSAKSASTVASGADAPVREVFAAALSPPRTKPRPADGRRRRAPQQAWDRCAWRDCRPAGLTRRKNTGSSCRGPAEPDTRNRPPRALAREKVQFFRALARCGIWHEAGTGRSEVTMRAFLSRLLLCAALAVPSPALALSRIKDLAGVEG